MASIIHSRYTRGARGRLRALKWPEMTTGILLVSPIISSLLVQLKMVK